MAWRTLEWSVVMGALCWLFVQLWTEAPYSRHRRPAQRRWFDRLLRR